MEKQDILDYVSRTPENVNVNVLGGMLDALTSGGSGSAEPFFFVWEIKGIDQDENPIIEETSTTYNDVISKLENGCSIYVHTIVPPEYQYMTMGVIDGITPLREVTHYYDPDSDSHDYYVGFGGTMEFHATSPTDILSMQDSGGGGNTPNYE